MTSKQRFKEGTYYARNRVKLLAASKKRYAARAQTESRDPFWKKLSVSPWSGMLYDAKRRATKRGMDYSLTPEWAAARWTGFCEVTKLPFTRGTGAPALFSPSIDRIDNSRGYTPDNSRFVLQAFNMMKSAGTDAEVVQIARAIVANAAPQAIS